MSVEIGLNAPEKYRIFFVSHETKQMSVNYFHFHKKRGLCLTGSGHPEVIAMKWCFSPDKLPMTQYPEGILRSRINGTGESCAESVTPAAYVEHCRRMVERSAELQTGTPEESSR